MSGRRKAQVDNGGMPPGARFSRAPLSGHLVRTGPAANDNGLSYRWLWLAGMVVLLFAAGIASQF